MTKSTNIKLNSSQISRTQNSPEDVNEAIKKVAANDPDLRSLNLANCNLSSESVLNLFKVLATNSYLVELFLQNNNINSAQVSILCNSLKTNQTLSVLDLSSNKIELGGAKEIIGTLKHNDDLVLVRLENNNLAEKEKEILDELKGKISNNLFVHEIKNKDHLKDHLKSVKNRPSVARLGIPSTEVGSPQGEKRQKDCCVIL